MRITKYGGKQHFQHVYPIVPTKNGHITLDCVTDRFNYEVPYSEKRDIIPTCKKITIEGLGNLSGVDTMDISLDALEESSIPLRKIIPPKGAPQHCLVPTQSIKRSMTKKSGKTLSPFRFDDQKQMQNVQKIDDFNLLNFLILSGISVAAGIGVFKLFSSRNTKRKATTTKKPGFNPKK
ncbi:hypothetical protein AB832_04515 [Flavobacteriaceae bacterium (ex Bugula neritina AB1)]|nr:hypothetical protein AB832_04515 [Flavobacteriaceae bacterium (ex Bugula neritina AB1)]